MNYYNVDGAFLPMMGLEAGGGFNFGDNRPCRNIE